MATDIKKTDIVLQYILNIARQTDWDSNELGAIHLIKYTYLADLAYAEHHNGKTYTGIPWRFLDYGPWSRDVYLRTDPAMAAIEAKEQEFYSSASLRWSQWSDWLYDQLDQQTDIVVAGAVHKYVRKFGTDTIGLLHYVYQTVPMLRAAPGELLDFSAAVKSKTDCPETNTLPYDAMTVRQKKKRKQKLLDIKKQLSRRLDKKLSEPGIHPKPSRYDDVFSEGVRQTEELAGKPMEPTECAAVFLNEVWKSKTRSDPYVP